MTHPAAWFAGQGQAWVVLGSVHLKTRTSTGCWAVHGYPARSPGACEAQLGTELVGVWLFGSCALGDFDPDRSDVDIQAVTRGTLPVEERRALAATLSHDSLPCPARGLEFVLYPANGLAGPDAPRFQLNLNTGSDMPERLDLDPTDQPRFWFVIDIAIGREHGIPLAGPAPGEVLPEIPRKLALTALMDALSWFEQNEGDSAQTVQSACRAWAYAREGVWMSKTGAARWARERSPDAELIDQARRELASALHAHT